MKKKFLGALIALGGSIAAVGSAFALYTGSLPADKTIQIGTKTTGDVTLAARVADADTAHAKLTPDSVSRTITLNACFDITNDDSVYIQDYYYAKLEFKISSTSEEMIDALKSHSWVELGTQGGEHKYETYWGWTWNGSERITEGEGSHYTDENHLNGDDFVKAEDGKSVSWTTHYPLLKSDNIASLSTEFLFHISMEGVTPAQYLAINEAGYSVSFNVLEADAAECAFVIGDAVGGWNDRDEYRMTVNPYSTSKEWMFKTGTSEGKSYLENGKDFKVHKGSTWCHGEGNHQWYESDNGKTIYWVEGSDWHF